MKRVLGVLGSMALMTGCGPQKEPEETDNFPKGNPLYESSGNSGTNPLHESTHLAIDKNGKPLIVYAQKVVEKATSGLKDTLKTNVRVIRPDTEGNDSAIELAADARPRAIGTVREDVHVLIEGDDGALQSALLGDVPKFTALPGVAALEVPQPVHQTIASLEGVPFAPLKAVGGEFDGQSVLAELGANAPERFPIGKALGVNDVKFIASGGETHREFAIAFSVNSVRSAVSQGNQLAAILDSNKTGHALAVWTDGKATKTIIHTSNGVVLFDGKDNVVLAPKTVSRCYAAGFSVDGAPWLLTVNESDATIITSDKAVLTTTTEDTRDALVDCTLAVAKTGVHAAWRVMRAPNDDARIDFDVIDYVNVPTDGAAILKTRHETAKNSISNVR